MSFDFKFGKKDGKTVATNAKQVFDDNLPEGVTPDVVKQVSDYSKEFHKELLAAATEPMIAELKASEGKQVLAEMEATAYGIKFGATMDVSGDEVKLTGSAGFAIGSHMMVATKRASKLWSN
ncbi:hypothetical protein [Clostridium sp.]|uniref:hypothetical protein n=1 Tax=Clostridium sp. TaxID=1506 RepID=UPI003F667652